MKTIGFYLLLFLCISLSMALPKQRWLRVTSAVVFSVLLAIFVTLTTGVSHEHQRATRDTIHGLASYLQAGDTGVVVRTILESDAILPTNGFNGMTFEKIMLMSQSDTNATEQGAEGDAVNRAP